MYSCLHSLHKYPPIFKSEIKSLVDGVPESGYQRLVTESEINIFSILYGSKVIV